jgi:hypothetical protein
MVTTTGSNEGKKPAVVNKKRIVVVRKKRNVFKTTASRRVGGLPSFRPRIAVEARAEENVAPEEDDDEFADGFTAAVDGDLPCDSLLAIYSLQASSQGLHVPLLSGGTVQAVLESQVFQRFEEHHASTILSELMHLLQTNRVRKLDCQGKSTTVACILTKDYIAGVWDAQEHHAQSWHGYSKVISWFVSGLSHWTESTISKDSMQDHWMEDLTVFPTNGDGKPSPLSLDNAMQYLLKVQVLLRDSTTQRYRLWLPQWGIVLKGWNEARQQLIAYVARSKGGEVSQTNVLHENRHACVSTKFLLDELTQQGKLRVVERPFGNFVKRADK